ncbi:zinc-dependent alcohol dehydrogenase [Paenibacillus sp. MBLB4367]|uniref:zinc-dependent alcohol dehydrogenase n=1 Tax=Paenibacillus sp. MBLB4367 TaxID=3384767 RepID=UPI00390815EB
MKAIVARNGSIYTMEVEEPELLPGHVLIRTEYTAVSPGTEMTAVRRSSDAPAALGYSGVGIVERTADDVAGLRKPGQRVACYGGPYVRHAELLAVPVNLTAPVPDHVSPEEAAFCGLGAIAIHALRTADLRFGENVVVVGLGILGNLTGQIAAAAACPTIGYDRNAYRASLLQQCGIKHAYAEQEDVEDAIAQVTDGFGADSVLLCASGNGEAMINSAFDWIRDRGKIVVVGDVSTEFSRGKMFGKEAQVLISRAGGPGRYDAAYERENRDYPVGFVRWTEGRNIREYIRLLDEKRVGVQSLISGIYAAADAHKAYEEYASSSTTAMGTLFRFA